MSYRVTAPLVIAPDQTGRSHHHYAGQLIPWLSEQWREHLLGSGMVEEVPDVVPPGVVPPVADEPAADSATIPERPNQVATKEVWVDYVVRALGADQATAEAMTKADLIALPAQ